MAEEARRRGWRVIAFAFAETAGLGPHADRVIPSRIEALGGVLATLAAERVSAALFSGKFWLGDVLAEEGGDGVSQGLRRRAGSLRDADLTAAVLATLNGLGVDVLDQRDFLGDWLVGAGACTARAPSGEEGDDVRRGVALARWLAGAHVGQTVILRRGLVTALEAIEGTSETIRRGGRLAGRGAVAVKAVAEDHDYRFDAPAIGPDTIAAAADVGVTVIAFEAGKVLLLERATSVRLADDAGIALVAVASL
jgi:hypothetical protein